MNNRGVILPVILIIITSIAVIIVSTSIIIQYFQRDIDNEVMMSHLNYLAQSALNLGIQEIKTGYNFDFSDSANDYLGIGIIDTQVVEIIQDNNPLSVNISCNIEDENNNYYILAGKAEIPSLSMEKEIKIQMKVRD